MADALCRIERISSCECFRTHGESPPFYPWVWNKLHGASNEKAANQRHVDSREELAWLPHAYQQGSSAVPKSLSILAAQRDE